MTTRAEKTPVWASTGTCTQFSPDTESAKYLSCSCQWVLLRDECVWVWLGCRLDDALIWNKPCCEKHLEFCWLRETLQTEDYSLLLLDSLHFTSRRAKRPLHRPPAVLTLLRFPVQSHDHDWRGRGVWQWAGQSRWGAPSGGKHGGCLFFKDTVVWFLVQKNNNMSLSFIFFSQSFLEFWRICVEKRAKSTGRSISLIIGSRNLNESI